MAFLFAVLREVAVFSIFLQDAERIPLCTASRSAQVIADETGDGTQSLVPNGASAAARSGTLPPCLRVLERKMIVR